MSLIKRSIVTITVTALAFGLTLVNQPEASILTAGLAATAVLLVAALILSLDKIFENIDGEYLLCVSTGSFVGLVAGYYLDQALHAMGLTLAAVRPLSYLIPVVFFGFVGSLFARSPGLRVFGGGGFIQDKEGTGGREKILDTSVIIDGRILDIAETNFLEGPFIIPNFVLREIQLISDSPDPVKRNRGRRGLDMLNKLQQHGSVKVKISYIDYADIREVDAKLVKLARETGAKLITNDFNLNKVAELQGVQVLNLNNLTNALKPVVLPGEDILIDVIKEGKDENQGIGYLEDGTMVVVENGRALLGKTVRVNVTSIIQTAAGKMIFTRAAGVVDDSMEEREDKARGRDNRPRGRSGGGRGEPDFRDIPQGQSQGQGQGKRRR